MEGLDTILVGLDLAPRGKGLTAGSAKSLEQARRVATSSGGRVRAVHSTWQEDVVEHQGHREIVHRDLDDEGRALLEEALAPVRAEGVEAELTVCRERLWVGLVYEVLRGNGDLVVVGKRTQESPEDGRRLGTMAKKLLRKCPCPVWAVRPEHDLALKLVLAASDLTPVGDRAVRYAASIASCDDCELHIVHAYQVPYTLQSASASFTEEEYESEIEKIRARAQESIARTLAGAGYEREPALHIGRNVPSVAIRDAVEHLHPDLLIMGTISRGGIPGVLVGNTAEKLLDRVDCSILGLKPDDFVCPLDLPD